MDNNNNIYNNNNNKIVFVTGATGFLGTNLCEYLLLENYIVYALYRSSKKTGELKLIANKFGKQENLKLVKGDITSYESLVKAIPDNCLYCFHLAAAIDDVTSEKQYEINVNGTANVIEACFSRKVQRLIYTSTIATFDFDDCFNLSKETKENNNNNNNNDNKKNKGFDSLKPINELTPKKNFPGLDYGRTKRIAELYIEESIRRGLDVVILSPGYIIGRYDESNIGSIILMIANNSSPMIRCGQAKACFSSAEECVKAHIKAAQYGKTGEEYVIGGNAYYWKELYEQVLFQLNIEKQVQVTSPLPLVLIGKKNDLLFKWFGLNKSKLIKPLVSSDQNNNINNINNNNNNMISSNKMNENSNINGSTTKVSKTSPRSQPYLTMLLAIFQSIDVNIDSSKAIDKLGYKSSTLEFMINDNIQWLKSKKLL